MKKPMVMGIAGLVLAAGSLGLVAYVQDPALNMSMNTMVASSVSETVAAAEAAQAVWENDMSGVGPSAYTGEYYDPAYEATRQCIVAKESGGNYAINTGNGYHGAYQFTQSTADNAAVKMGRPDLVGVPPEQWNRYEQDMAFWVTWNHGAGSGNWPTAYGC